MMGSELCGFSPATMARNKASTNLCRFMDKCYVSPSTCHELFQHVQSEHHTGAENRIARPNPRHLLLALCCLKKHPTKYELAGFLDCCKETALKQVRNCVNAFASLRKNKIRWIFDDEEGHEEMFTVSVDGVHCRTYEPRIKPSTKWHSKKFHGAALSYETGISMFHDQVAWVMTVMLGLNMDAAIQWLVLRHLWNKFASYQ